jgi:phosphohistidine swiveling domain-containing protein
MHAETPADPPTTMSPGDPGDVYAFATKPSTWWTTSNYGEAVPGVLTPLTWTWWGPASDIALRGAFANIGVLEPSEAVLPDDVGERLFGLFYGRYAGCVDFVYQMGDRIPGTTGAAVAGQMLGHLPSDFVPAPTRRRYPAIAVKLPRAYFTSRRAVRRRHREITRWWAEQVTRAPELELAAARALWAEALANFVEVTTLQATTLFAAIQPSYEQLEKLAMLAGDATLAGRAVVAQGSHAEVVVVEDMWRLSRGEITLAAFLAAHGFHGPNEGELASHMWREDPSPVETMLRQYAAKDGSESPMAVALQRAEDRRRARQEMRDALPRARQQQANVAFALADRNLPLRGIGKEAFLKTIDVGRAAARRIGTLLADSGALAEPDDVFYLSSQEIASVGPDAGYAEIVAARRALRESWRDLSLPASWQGMPAVTRPATAGESRRNGLVMRGLGACPGVVEGTIRVVADPIYDDVESGEILVAPYTDPSWAAIMFTCAALVVDIGGVLSHAAVVARELGIPCVMGTQDGTRMLRTGDRCRVDGNAGTVELLLPVEA